MPISSACQQGGRSTSLQLSPLVCRLFTPKQTHGETSDELHALSSAEETSHAKLFSLKSAPNLQILPENETTVLSAEPALCVSDIPEHALPWLGTTGSDVICSYTLGTFKLEAQTVIELFQ